jgi:hypothetical protein
MAIETTVDVDDFERDPAVDSGSVALVMVEPRFR